jgi:hypothetical protein
MPWFVVLIIVVVVLAVPAVLIARLGAAKHRKETVGSSSTFSLTPDEVPPADRTEPRRP